MSWKRVLAYAAACVAGVALLVLLAVRVHPPKGEEEAPEVEPVVAVKTATAEVRTVATEVRIEGKIEALPDQESRISAPIQGQLTEVAVREGERVDAGQLLMTLYNADIAGTVRQAHGSLTAAQATALRAEKAVLLRDVEERTGVTKAEATLREAEAKLSLLRAGPRSQEIAQAASALDRETAKLHELEAGTRPEQVAAVRHTADAERAALQRLRNGPTEQEVAAAEAGLRAEQADLDRLKAGARPQEREQAKAHVAAAQQALETAEAELRRKERLCDEGIVSVAERQTAAAAAAAARSEYVNATQSLSLVEQGPRIEEIRAQQAKRDQAAAELARVRVGSRPEEIAQQESKLRAAEAALQEAEAGPRAEEIAQQRAEVAKARQALDLLQAPPRPQDVVQAQAAVRDAQADLDRARAGRFETAAVRQDLNAARGQSEAAAGSFQYAAATLDKTLIRAPIGGTVSSVLANVGEVVSPGTPVLELLNLRAVQLRGRVPIPDLAKLGIGSEADVAVEGLPGRTFHAGVAIVSPDVDPGTGTGQVVLWIQNDDGALKEGMFGRATAPAEEAGAVIVPTEAVVSAEAEQHVYVVEPNEEGEGLVAHEVPVELGRTEEGMTEILAGLSGGEQVVVQGAYGLPDEAKVTVGGEEPSDGSP